MKSFSDTLISIPISIFGFINFLLNIASHTYPVFEYLFDCRNIASRSFFCRHYFGRRCSSRLAELVPLSCICGTSTCYSDKFMISVTVPWCHKDVHVSVVFLVQLHSRIFTGRILLWPMILMTKSKIAVW